MHTASSKPRRTVQQMGFHPEALCYPAILYSITCSLSSSFIFRYGTEQSLQLYDKLLPSTDCRPPLYQAGSRGQGPFWRGHCCFSRTSQQCPAQRCSKHVCFYNCLSPTPIFVCFIRFYMPVIFFFSKARGKIVCLCTCDKITHRP